jgi:DNA ligase (NAD+)
MTATAGTAWVVKDIRELIEERMGENLYPIDGVVFKVDDFSKRMTLGSTSRAPRWAVALKFLQERITPKLLGITVQVGRSGALTPVAELEPTWVDGSTISRATLHNEAQAARLGVQIGDHVLVAKAGAIIPEVLGSVEHEARRKELDAWHADKDPEVPAGIRAKFVEDSLALERPPFNLLTFLGGACPSCGSTDLQKRTLEEATDKKAARESVAWYCMNSASCPAQLPARIQHFCSRKALNIEGIGEEASDAIATRWRLHREQPDIFELFIHSAQWFAELTWTTESGSPMTFGESRGAKAYASVQAAKQLPLHRHLIALGIQSIGENTSKEISRLFASAEHLLEMGKVTGKEGSSDVVDAVYARYMLKPKEFEAQYGAYKFSPKLGPDSARKLADYLCSPAGFKAIETLAMWGVKSDNHDPIPAAMAPAEGDAVTGKSFCVTGTLSVPRPQIEALITAAGGKLASGVSKKTNYLVAGEDCGSKLEKAKAAGVKILTEKELRDML